MADYVSMLQRALGAANTMELENRQAVQRNALAMSDFAMRTRAQDLQEKAQIADNDYKISMMENANKRLGVELQNQKDLADQNVKGGELISSIQRTVAEKGISPKEAFMLAPKDGLWAGTVKAVESTLGIAPGLQEDARVLGEIQKAKKTLEFDNEQALLRSLEGVDPEKLAMAQTPADRVRLGKENNLKKSHRVLESKVASLQKAGIDTTKYVNNADTMLNEWNEIDIKSPLFKDLENDEAAATKVSVYKQTVIPNTEAKMDFKVAKGDLDKLAKLQDNYYEISKSIAMLKPGQDKTLLQQNLNMVRSSIEDFDKTHGTSYADSLRPVDPKVLGVMEGLLDFAPTIPKGRMSAGGWFDRKKPDETERGEGAIPFLEEADALIGMKTGSLANRYKSAPSIEARNKIIREAQSLLTDKFISKPKSSAPVAEKTTQAATVKTPQRSLAIGGVKYVFPPLPSGAVKYKLDKTAMGQFLVPFDAQGNRVGGADQIIDVNSLTKLDEE